MRKILYIFNAFYPVNPGETFLANEIDYLMGFDKIYICPIFANDNKQQYMYKRTHVQNVEIVRVSEYSIRKKLKSVLCSGFQRDIYKELLMLKRKKMMSASYIKKAFKFVAHCRFFADEIEKHIKTHIKSDDKLVLYSYWMNHDAYVASIIKRRLKNCEFFLTRAHRIDIYEYADGGYIPMRETIIGHADLLCPISEDGKKYLIENYNTSACKISVQRLGTADHGVNITEKSGVLRIVSCSWMRKVKRLDLLLESLELVDFPVEWTHYGDGDEYESITRKAKEIKNSFLTCSFMGATKNEKVLGDLGNIPYDVFINVSSSEGVPVSIMEAMSFGKPIIATDVGGSREIVHDNCNGFLLPIDFTTDELALKLKYIYELSANQYRSMCCASRHIWDDLCHDKVNYQLFNAILQKEGRDI